MAAAFEYTEEQLNYYRICYVVADIPTEGLRTIFKQEWDSRYKTTLGEWKDQPKNGMDFWKMESPRNKSRKARLLSTMQNGNTAEWDCTMLFYAILFSDCIGGLNSVVRSNMDDLRKFRNEEFAHMPRGHLSNGDFQIATSKVKTAFLALSLPTLKINDVQNLASFPTEELNEVLRKVDDLKQEVKEKEKEVQVKEIELLEKDKVLQEKGTKLEQQLKELQEKEKELEQKEEERRALEEQLHSNVSPFCILPPKPTHDIAARESQVEEIMRKLQTLKRANDGLSILYLSGNPGSGKSHLARLVAKRFYEEVKEIPSEVSFVMTLNAENSEKILNSYVLFAQHCKCPGYEITETYGSKDLNTDEKISYLKTLISAKIKHYTSWLLVADNVTSVCRSSGHLPNLGNELWARGQMLLTTQDIASMPLTSSSIENISISAGMDSDDACFLLNRLSGITDVKVEKEIVKALDFQPLALASAATYVGQVRKSKATSKFGWSDYLKKVQEGKRSATETILAETNESYPKSMTKAIRLAVEKAMADDIIFHYMFNFLSFCALQPILQEAVIEYIKAVDEDFEDEDMIRMRMNRCSLLLIEEEEGGVYIRVHSVVHDVIKYATKDCTEDENYKVIYGTLMSFSIFEELDSVTVGTRISPHLKMLSLKLEKMAIRKGKPEFSEKALKSLSCYPGGLWTLGGMCRDHSEFGAALIYYELLLRIIESNHEGGDLKNAACYHKMGIVHSEQGETDQAKDYHKRALKIRLKKLGPEHIDVAASYNSLGNSLCDLGETDQAKEFYERALKILLTKLGPEHVDVAASYNNLGRLHSDLGETDQAKDYYRCALEIYLKTLGPHHVDATISYSNLGSLHSDLGETDQAKDYYKNALEIRLKKLGPEHVKVAASYNNLGTLHHDLGETDQAKDYYKHALDISLKKLGPEHVNVAASYNNLGSLHSDLGETDQAKEYYERALEIRLKKLGPEHVCVATSYNNLGSIHSYLGETDKAKEYYTRALEICLKELGPEHVYVAASYNNMGNLQSALGETDQAKDSHKRALEIYLKKLGTEHVNVAASYNNLGNLHSALGETDQAKEFYKRALEIRLKKLGPDHVDVAASYNNLGSLHSDQGETDQAKDYYKRALEIRLKKLGPEHVDVIASYNNLGSLHSDLGETDQAEDYYKHALEIGMKKLRPEHVNAAASFNNMGQEERILATTEKKECVEDNEAVLKKKKRYTC
ncbi:Nephrocystin-3 [Stylophora pistillata]|uniref:Nephrocystin-3 n=1 Tax=Stylophora pistillata TaxID=50429 RepID=A0A2B4RAG9_STYPI|nr:Nephrocystin-3 [Stylophora pistillata]